MQLSSKWTFYKLRDDVCLKAKQPSDMTWARHKCTAVNEKSNVETLLSPRFIRNRFGAFLPSVMNGFSERRPLLLRSSDFNYNNHQCWIINDDWNDRHHNCNNNINNSANNNNDKTITNKLNQATNSTTTMTDIAMTKWQKNYVTITNVIWNILHFPAGPLCSDSDTAYFQIILYFWEIITWPFHRRQHYALFLMSL